jgi:threonine dehydrogenase-like Zn-dependent dehydrogenase
MHALVNTGPGILEIQQLPVPEPGEGQVRMRTLACGICATDLEMIAGWDRTGFPAIPGHEWCGVVDAVGPGVPAGLLGRHCVGDNVLPDGGEVGFEHPGGYAECFLTQAANLRPLPPGTSPTAATLIEPLAVCLRGLGRLRPFNPRQILVVGDGTIGLLMTILLLAEETEGLTVVGGVPERLAMARELGARHALDYRTPDLAAQLGNGFSTVVEASGTTDGLRTALECAANEAKILILGDYADARADLRWNDLLHRELDLIGSNAGTGAWDQAVGQFAELGERLGRLVTHTAPYQEYADALDLARTRRDGAVRVVLTWPHETP